MKLCLITIIAAILSFAVSSPIMERKRRSASSCNPVLNAITGAQLLNDIINDISIRKLSRNEVYTGAKSICEAFTHFKYSNDSNSTTNVDAASCSDSVSSVIVDSLRNKSCSWVNGVSTSILPECKSHPLEIDLTCHEIQLADLAFKVTVNLPGRNGEFEATENLRNWVSRFIDSSRISAEAYQIIHCKYNVC